MSLGLLESLGPEVGPVYLYVYVDGWGMRPAGFTSTERPVQPLL